MDFLSFQLLKANLSECRREMKILTKEQSSLVGGASFGQPIDSTSCARDRIAPTSSTSAAAAAAAIAAIATAAG